MGLSADEVAGLIAESHPDTYQTPVTAVIKLDSSGINPFAYQYKIPVQIDGQAETYNARYSPTVNATELRSGTAWWATVNELGEYELVRVKASDTGNSYGGIIPPPNMAHYQHDHTDAEGGGALGADTVNTSQLVNGAVTLAKMAANSVDSSKIVDGSIATTDLANDAVTFPKLQNATAAGQFVAAPTSGTFPQDYTARAIDNADMPIVDTSHGGTGADLDNTTIPYDGVVTKDGNVMRITRYIESSSAPTLGDDNTQGYELGSLWRHFTGGTDDLYQCIDAATGAAIWRKFAMQNLPAVFQAVTSLFEIISLSGMISPYYLGTMDSDVEYPYLYLKRRRASLGSPQNNDILGRWSSGDGTGFTVSGSIDMVATQNHSGANHGGKLDFYTTPNGSSTLTKRVTIDQDGKLIALAGLDVSGAVTLPAGSLSASVLGSGTIDNARVNWAAPGNIGSTTPATGAFTNLSASLAALLPQSAPGSPANGNLWYDSTQKTLAVRTGGLSQDADTTVFIQRTDVTVGNTATEGTLISDTNAIGTRTIPANYMPVGKVLSFVMRGRVRGDFGTNTLVIRFKIDTTTIIALAINAGTAAINTGFEIRGDFRASSGGLDGAITMLISGLSPFVVNFSSGSIAWTSSRVPDITADWASAVSTDTITNTFLKFSFSK